VTLVKLRILVAKVRYILQTKRVQRNMQKPMLKFKDFVKFINENRKKTREEALIEMMKLDQELGLYDEHLLEGGAYGHLSHPFEDFGLTMSDLQDMITTTVNGAFGPENFVQEKN